MKQPPLSSTIERRLLVNYRVEHPGTLAFLG